MTAPSAGEGNDVTLGSIREAMAYRVKYRIGDDHRAKRSIHLEMMCVNNGNRGGMYPMPQTVMNLGIGIFQDGFDSEDANHGGVCVQEIPVEATPRNWLPSYDWNQRNTSDTLLQACFPSDAEVAAYGTLSHSHLLLTLLCWLHGVKWDIPADSFFKDTWARVVSPSGHLRADAVALVDPMLAEAIQRGLCMEVLSWKMQIEEPTAARKISQALNKSHQRALETTQLTAMAVLSGVVIAQQTTTGLTHGAQYETVKEKVRGELDTYVDDPDFIELFDFTISLGAELNTFIRDLLARAS